MAGLEKQKVELIISKHNPEKFVKIDGEYYLPIKNKESRKENILQFKKVDIKEYEKTIDELAEKISPKVNVKKLIKQGLYQITLEGIEQIKKELQKEKPRIRNNEGCFFLSVGKVPIQLRD